MKHHTIPAPTEIPTVEGGSMKHYQAGFNWKKACSRALQKKLERAIHLARTNPDYQIKYPNECRDNPSKKILSCCHPEAKLRILEEHEKILTLAVVPVVDRPKRLNRNG